MAHSKRAAPDMSVAMRLASSDGGIKKRQRRSRQRRSSAPGGTGNGHHDNAAGGGAAGGGAAGAAGETGHRTERKLVYRTVAVGWAKLVGRLGPTTLQSLRSKCLDLRKVANDSAVR